MEKWFEPKIIVPPPGPKAKELIERDQRVMSPSLTRTAPLVGVKTQGVWVQDIDGNVYLDFGSGIAVVNVGHRHPKVVEAIKRQVEICDHVNSLDYYTVPQVEYSEKLLKVVPGRFEKRIFFSNSGTEAVECAIKAAKWHTRKPYFIGFFGCFHGRTMGSLALTTLSTKARKYYFPMMPGAIHVPYPYCYRCTFKQSYPECGLWCIGYIEDVIFKKLVDPEEVAGFIIEPIQGAGGYIVPPDEFLPRLRKVCDNHNILFMDDEVQTGFGRTGKMWACEQWGFVPDILCGSKAIAAGLPLGVCVARAEVMDWAPSAHETTLSGNPIVMSAAIAVLEVLMEENLLSNATKVGEYLLKRFCEMQERHGIMGDVRGKGLMIGVEFVKDRKTKEPASKERTDLVIETFKRGLLILEAGESSVRIAPPLILTTDQADIGLQIFEEALKGIEKKL